MTSAPAPRTVVGSPGDVVRTDIQGLRALAVGLVLVYHLWPTIVRGGYIGVDVFFVISGFLITSHLLRHPPRTVGDFAGFWARRLRRLLPASLLVILVSLLVGLVAVPVSQLAVLGRDALASTLYAENWTLAFSAVDYLGATQAPSPFQHYWSLGVEEQFYLLWPFVIAAGVWTVGRMLGRPRLGVAVVVMAFAVASFVVSVLWTASDPAFAYFATPTRLWELAIGGAVALLPAAWTAGLPNGARAAAGWLGLVVILVPALLYTETTPFPGSAAVVPVAGAAIVIAARAGREPWSPGALLGLRPVQFVGDTSYSIYLWHFPIIVLGTAALGPLLLPAKLIVVALCLILAQLTRALVEDPVRRSAWLGAPVRRTYIAALVTSALVVGATFLPQAQVQRIVTEQAAQAAANAILNEGCEGAAALAEAGCDLRGSGITPDPAIAANDRSDAYGRGCLAERPFPEVVRCDFGDPDAKFSVALVGNSHAVQWLPALQVLAPDLNFSITTFVASRCAVSAADQVFDTAASTRGCERWGSDVVDATDSGAFDLVIVTAASDEGLVGVSSADQFAAKVSGYEVPLRRWADSGTNVLVLRDTPQPLVDVVGCVATHTDDPEACDGDRAVWLSPDPLVEAAALFPGDVRVSDLSALLCGTERCYSVIGGVLAYFDSRHISGTFSESLAPYLRPSVQNALGLG